MTNFSTLKGFKYFTLSELVSSSTGQRKKMIPYTLPPAEREAWLFIHHPEAYACLCYMVDEFLDPLRAILNAPIFVNSGFRTNLLNIEVGGVCNSKHKIGCAVDITCNPSLMNKLLRHIRIRCDLNRLFTFIHYPSRNFIHVQFNPTPEILVEVRRLYLD